MLIGVIKIKLYAAWVHSLKEKRMIIQSIIGKTRSRFNVSIHEIDALDIHQTMIIGLSMVSNNENQLNSSLDKVLDFIQNHTEATILDTAIEIISTVESV